MVVEALDLDSAAHAASSPAGPFPHTGGTTLADVSHVYLCEYENAAPAPHSTTKQLHSHRSCQFLYIRPNKAQQVVRVQ